MYNKKYIVLRLACLIAFIFFHEGTMAQKTNTFPDTGYVGLGTLTPAARLSFNNVNDGSNRADGITWFNDRPLYYGIYRTPGEWNAPVYQQLRINWLTGIIIDPGNEYEKSYLEIARGGLRVTSGNVLIGRSSQANADYKLDVNGNIRANKVVVNTTGADFVFDTAYNLPSLEEVQAFIHKNRHLPGIPPAKEMQDNGMNVGDMQTKMLQKIEELTLYILKQQEQIDSLNSRLSEVLSASKP